MPALYQSAVNMYKPGGDDTGLKESIDWQIELKLAYASSNGHQLVSPTTISIRFIAVAQST